MKLVYTGTQIRNAERPYLEAPDYDGYLMQRAADALAAEAHDMLADAGQHSQYTRILLLVGPGNNGADTVYAGTRLHQQGYRIEAVLFDPTGNNLELLARESGEGTRVLDTVQSLRDIASYSLIIDGILGTGAKGAARGEAGEYLAKLRAVQLDGKLPPVLACDAPTGLDSERGTLHEPSLAAERTVTFIGRKLPAGTHIAEHCGTIKLYDLGIPEALKGHKPMLRVMEREDYRDLLEKPSVSSHKYNRGVLGMLTGSHDYPGAALMSVRAALNTGVGMVRFNGKDDTLRTLMLGQNPETVCFTGPPAHEYVHAWAGGSGTGPENLDHNRYLLNAPEPAILDAGAVDLAADYMMAGHSLGEHKILTPHAGELERFLRRIHEHSPQRWEEMLDGALVPSREDINAEPFRWVRAACELSGATVMLKGSTTLIAAPVGATYSVHGATGWLATAGSGDTLTGILGALLAQYMAAAQERHEQVEGCTYASLAALAVYLHNRAALASLEGRKGPVPPSRVAAYLPQAIAELLDEKAVLDD